MITRRLLCAGAALAPLPLLSPAFAQGEARFPAAWLQGIRQEAARAGVDKATLDAALADIREIPKVMELARNQPEFKMTWETYQGRVVSNERIARGRALLAENRAAIERFAGPAGHHLRSPSRCGASRATTARGSATSRWSRRWPRWSTTTSAPSSSGNS